MLFINVNLLENQLYKLKNQINNVPAIIKQDDIEYVHMRGEMNSYRFEISNQRENKFCSHEVSFRLHFKTTRYFDGHVQAFHFGQCLHDILSPKMKFHFCQSDRYEIHTRIEFQTYMRIKRNIQRVCAYSFLFG